MLNPLTMALTKEKPLQSFWKDCFIGFILAILLTFIFYPGVFTMEHFPLLWRGWEASDPAVSTTVTVPSHRIIRDELFKHGNLLWSNLRAFGHPLLGNEIEGAPLFPLTWFLLLLPEPLVWNVMVIVRLILLGWITYLISRRVFNFSVSSSILFTLCFAYSLYVLRFLNHPWQNGLLSGLIYLYALDWVIKAPSQISLFEPRILAVAFATYLLVTCGFPEGALMGGLLAFLTVLPNWLHQLRGRGRFLIFHLTIGHGIGFALSSPQIFAILEFMEQTHKDWKSSVGNLQFQSFGILWDFVTRVTDVSPGTEVIHFFHLGPLFLVLFFLSLFRCDRLRPKLSPYDTSALVMLVFFVLKAFPLLPFFNQWVASLPVFKQTHFVGYFFTLAIWAMALFTVRGWETLHNCFCKMHDLGKEERRRVFLSFSLSALLVLFAFWIEIQRSRGVSWYQVRLHFYLLSFFLLVSGGALFLKGAKIGKVIGPLLMAAILAEFILSTPQGFVRYKEWEFGTFNSEPGRALRELLVKNSLMPHEVRETSFMGDYISAGVATSENGIPPIEPLRYKYYRLLLFRFTVDGSGHLGLLGPKYSHAYRLSSINLHISKQGHPKITGEDFNFLGRFGDHSFYWDPKALPRAYVASGCLPVKTDPETFSVLSHKNFRLGTVVLEDLSEQTRNWCLSYGVPLIKVGIVRDKGSLVDLSEVKGPAIVTLNDLYYPGWKAFDLLTGGELEVRPANHAFRAVLLPESRPYRIQFLYRPYWLFLSFWLVGGALLLIGILCGRVFLTGLMPFLMRRRIGAGNEVPV